MTLTKSFASFSKLIWSRESMEFSYCGIRIADFTIAPRSPLHPNRDARSGTPGSGYCPARDSLGNRRLRHALYHGLRRRVEGKNQRQGWARMDMDSTKGK